MIFTSAFTSSETFTSLTISSLIVKIRAGGRNDLQWSLIWTDLESIIKLLYQKKSSGREKQSGNDERKVMSG